MNAAQEYVRQMLANQEGAMYRELIYTDPRFRGQLQNEFYKGGLAFLEGWTMLQNPWRAEQLKDPTSGQQLKDRQKSEAWDQGFELAKAEFIRYERGGIR